jgi:hypothetical protein
MFRKNTGLDKSISEMNDLTLFDTTSPTKVKPTQQVAPPAPKKPNVGFFKKDPVVGQLQSELDNVQTRTNHEPYIVKVKG